MAKTELPLVLLTHPLPAEWLASLDSLCRMEVGEAGRGGISNRLMRLLPEARGLICLLTDRIDEGVLAKASHLKVVSNYAAGLDNIDLPACTRRGIPVGHTPGILTAATADLTMALLLAAGRGLFPAASDARQGIWKTWEPAGWLGTDLEGACLGIVGLGHIGSAVARRAAGFGLRIIYINSEPVPELENTLNMHMVEFSQLLVESDFISLHVPLTPQTRHLFDRQAFRLMKKTAILVNTARGAIIVMDDLAEALQNGWIAGAALDVTDPEPLPPDHILYSLPNCLIVPHIGSATYGTRHRMAGLACRNLVAGLVGERLPVCANPEVYA